MLLCNFVLSSGTAMFLYLFTMSVTHAQEVITVYGAQMLFQHAAIPTDTPNLIRLAPGGAVNRNGALTSIPQYRGLHTYRVQTHLDGRQPHTAGPNWMDSPLHYMPAFLTDSVQVHRGIAPVRVGSAIGGYINADSYTSEYGLTDDYELHGRVMVDNDSSNSGNNAGVFLSASNAHSRYHLYGVHDEADETNTPDGEILASQYERDFFGFGTGQQLEQGEWTFDYARNNTGEAGTPALPMDIDYYHTDLMNLRVRHETGAWQWEVQLHYQETDHQMSNDSLRAAPDFSLDAADILPPFRGTDRRWMFVEGLSAGGKLTASRVWGDGMLLIGADVRQSENSSTVYDPDVAAFFVQNFDEATTDEYGLFAEWSGTLDGSLRAEFGVRLQHTRTDANPIRHFRPTCELLLRVNADGTHAKYGPSGTLHTTFGTGDHAAQPCSNPAITPADWMPPPAMSLATLSRRFNDADRSQEDTEIDAAATLYYPLSDSVDLEFGIAHKTRAPAYVERYTWVPLEVNAGLGDGNNYVGNPNLSPERSWQLELGLDWKDRGWKLSPRVFVRRVDDFITGVPSEDPDVIRVSRVLNGDPTPIQFENVDAEFYGADAVFGFPLGDDWRLDSTVSYVRGKLRETFQSQRLDADGATRTIRDDNVYRMPPLRGIISVSRTLPNWVVAAEVDWAARQSKVSQLLLDDPQNAKNHNRATSGYALYNLRAQYAHPSMGMKLFLGVENLTDRSYVNHMDGFNRVPGGAAAVGARLPGAGRRIYARMEWEW